MGVHCEVAWVCVFIPEAVSTKALGLFPCEISEFTGLGFVVRDSLVRQGFTSGFFKKKENPHILNSILIVDRPLQITRSVMCETRSVS